MKIQLKNKALHLKFIRGPCREEGKHPYYTRTHLCIWIHRTIDVPLIPCLSLWTLYSAIFCHLLVPYSIFLRLLSFSSLHTFIGGLSLVGIHQGPSLSPAMPQWQWTIVSQRQQGLLMSSGFVCMGVYVCVCERGWVMCAPICTSFNHAYYICINMAHL